LEQIDVNGMNIAYQREGEGPPLVLLHGVLHDSRFWRPQLDGLSDSFCVVAWDAPGSGQSDDPPEFCDMDEYADWAAGLIRGLELESAHVCGLSLGGAMALALYRRHPWLVRSLILADTYAGWRGSLPADVVDERLQQCLQESEQDASVFVPNWLPGLLTERAPQSITDQLVSVMSDFHPVGYRSTMRAMAACDERALLASIAVPTLLIWGEEDKRSPVNVAKQFEASIPGARLVIIPSTGHVSSFEHPEAFNEAVRAFCLALE
jgi:pimeloyl-ACP methyl ester carboxylesterase